MRKRLAYLLLALGSTLFFSVALEFTLRLAGYNPFRNLLDGRELILRKSSNAEMVYELTPNSEGYAWGAEVTVNSFGFRDREYVPENPDGLYRIVVIGDSITFGNFLRVEETFPELLEQSFRQHGIGAEILNLGVGGYDTIQEVAFLEEVGLQFHPDEVILGYCMNDLGVTSTNLRYINRAQKYGKPIYNLRSLQFFRVGLDNIEAMLFSQPSGPKYEGLDVESDADLDDLIRRVDHYLSSVDELPHDFSWYANRRRIGRLRLGFERLKTLSERHGFEVSVLIIPWPHKQVDAYGAAYDIVRHEAVRNDFNVIEVVDEFIEADGKGLKIGRRDKQHVNKRGHRLMAQKLFEFYTDNGDLGYTGSRE